MRLWIGSVHHTAGVCWNPKFPGPEQAEPIRYLPGCVQKTSLIKDFRNACTRNGLLSFTVHYQAINGGLANHHHNRTGACNHCLLAAAAMHKRAHLSVVGHTINHSCPIERGSTRLRIGVYGGRSTASQF